MKRIKRNEEQQDKYTWLELHGSGKNNPGWIYNTKADIIAFETKIGFLIAKVSDIKVFISFNLIKEYSSTIKNPEEIVNKVYKRNGGKRKGLEDKYDELMLVKTGDIKRLSIYVWEKSLMNGKEKLDICKHLYSMGLGGGNKRDTRLSVKLNQKFNYCPLCGVRFEL